MLGKVPRHSHPEMPTSFLGQSAFIGMIVGFICCILFFLGCVAWIILSEAPIILVILGFFLIVGMVIRWRWNPLKG